MLGRREFLQALAPALLARPTAPPNFLVIVSDDQGIGDVGCYGAPDMKTPNLDRLAARGIRFTDWHANSPVCSPSRASLLTGRYPQRAGIPQILFSKPNFDVPGLRAGESTLATELRKLGYRTSAIGKWHLGSTPESRPLAQGFDEFLGYYSGWIDYYSHRFYTLRRHAHLPRSLAQRAGDLARTPIHDRAAGPGSKRRTWSARPATIPSSSILHSARPITR